MFGGPHLFPKNMTSLNSWMNRGENGKSNGKRGLDLGLFIG